MRITLTGSMRFEREFWHWERELTLMGHSVYSVCDWESRELTQDQKEVLDLVHFDKIYNSDAILVLNVDKYVGFSTQREIQWARMQGKKLYWLEPQQPKGEFLASSILPVISPPKPPRDPLAD